jgi:hypothetical protein
MAAACYSADSAFIEKPSLEFTRLDLTDGRSLRNVVVKSYDETTAKLFLVADKKAMTIPLSLVPRAFQERIRAGIAHTASSASPPVVDTDTKSSAAEPKSRPLPPPPANPQQEQAASEAIIAAHRSAALSRAEKYFRYEYQPGSNSIKVTAVDFESTKPRAMPGWPGRYETTGKVYLEFYDSVGGTYSRKTGTFEAQTEQKPGEEIQVVTFTSKT